MPSSPEQFKAAIIKAHEAGDTAGAQQLAAIYKQRFVAPQQESSVADELLRQGARTGRNIVSGVVGGALDLANVAARPLGEAMAYGASALGFEETAAGLRSGPESYSRAIKQGIDDATSGYTAPRGRVERFTDNASDIVTGVAAGHGIGQAAKGAKLLAETLKAPAGRLGAAGVAGSALGYAGAADAAPDNPLAQAAAAVLGGLAPGAAMALPGVAARTAGKALAIDPAKVRALEEAGLAPNMAAAGGRVPKTVDRLLAVVPGGAGVTERATGRNLDRIGKQVSAAIAKTGTPGTAETAGAALQAGTQKALARFKGEAAKKYDAFDASMNRQQRVSVANTLGFAQNIGSKMTPALREAFENPALKPIFNALGKDAADGALPFEALQALRSRVGEALTDTSLVTTLPRAEMRQMYGALSEDLKAAAKAAGPDAIRKFNEANQFYADNIKQVDRWFERVNASKKTAEQAFAEISRGVKQGGSGLRNLLRGVPEDEARTVRATVLDRMGRDASGNGDFDSVRFLGGYRKLAPEAKTELFRGAPGHERNLDKLAEAADILRGVNSFENYSRSGEQVIAAVGATGAVANPLMAVKGYLLSRATASMMHSPRMTRWLANAVEKKNPSALAEHVRALATIAKAEPEIANDIAALADDMPAVQDKRTP